MTSCTLGLPPENPVIPGGPFVISGAISFENFSILLLDRSLTEIDIVNSFGLLSTLRVAAEHELYPTKSIL